MRNGTEEARRFLIEAAYSRNMPVPDAILNAPELFPGLEWVWQAFLLLNSCRQTDFGAARSIPWTAIAQYSRDIGLDTFEREELEHHLNAMDEVYLTWRAEQKPNGHGGTSGRDEPPGVEDTGSH